jgi:uncharacterized membrane protein YphA (DoxX/SURF4 family)
MTDRPPEKGLWVRLIILLVYLAYSWIAKGFSKMALDQESASVKIPH